MLTCCGADKWEPDQFGELISLIHESKYESATPQGASGERCLLKLPRTKLPVRILFEKATSKLTVPYKYENQLVYELADVEIDDKCTTVLVSRELEDVYFPRIAGVIALIEVFTFSYPAVRSIRFSVALGDLEREGQSLSFSSCGSDDLLLPDPYFIMTRGYEQERTTYAQHPVAWIERINKAYWRGSASGFMPSDITKSPRIAVALACKNYEHLFNVALVGGGGTELPSLLTKIGVLGEKEPQERILDYKYQIDIDGYSNAWVGFFLKLLTGSPVLKINSEFGYRQWYYWRLIPWVNYVPVNSNLSDLVTNLEALRNDVDLAKNIGARGRELALALTYESQLKIGAAAILKNVRTVVNL